MKKTFIILLLAAAILGCGQQQQRILTVINQSDWRAVVTVTDFVDTIGNQNSAASYVIGAVHDPRGLPNRASFILCEHGDCNVLSVNGAKIKSKTDTQLILENAPSTIVHVINETGKDIRIQNEPSLGDTPSDFYYGGIYQDQSGTLWTDYKPVFPRQLIAKDRTAQNPVNMPVYAWQLFEITDPKEFSSFAYKHITIAADTSGLYVAWERVGDDFFLRITN